MKVDAGASPVAPRTEREHWKAIGDIEDRIPKRGRGPNTAELERVADVYQAHVDGNPTEAIHKHLESSQRTAARRASQARNTGVLPKYNAGQKKG